MSSLAQIGARPAIDGGRVYAISVGGILAAFGLRLAFGIALLMTGGVAPGLAFRATFLHGGCTDILMHAFDVRGGGQLEVDGQLAIDAVLSGDFDLIGARGGQ